MPLTQVRDFCALKCKVSMRWLAVGIALLVVGAMGHGQNPKNTPSPQEGAASPFVIDFSPLDQPREPAACEINLSAVTRTGETFRGGVSSSGRPAGRGICDMLKGQFLSVGWQVRRITGSQLLVFGKKGTSVEKLEMEVKGLDNAFRPVIRRAGPKDLVAPPPIQAIAVIEFHDLVRPNDGMRRRLDLILEPLEGDHTKISTGLGGMEPAAELAQRLYQMACSNWEIVRDGSRLIILSCDGKNGPVALKGVRIVVHGDIPIESLPSIIATDNVQVRRGN